MRWIKLLSVRWPDREGRAKLCVRSRKCSFVNQQTVAAGGDVVLCTMSVRYNPTIL